MDLSKNKQPTSGPATGLWPGRSAPIVLVLCFVILVRIVVILFLVVVLSVWSTSSRTIPTAYAPSWNLRNILNKLGLMEFGLMEFLKFTLMEFSFSTT